MAQKMQVVGCFQSKRGPRQKADHQMIMAPVPLKASEVEILEDGRILVGEVKYPIARIEECPVLGEKCCIVLLGENGSQIEIIVANSIESVLNEKIIKEKIDADTIINEMDRETNLLTLFLTRELTASGTIFCIQHEFRPRWPNLSKTRVATHMSAGAGIKEIWTPPHKRDKPRSADMPDLWAIKPS